MLRASGLILLALTVVLAAAAFIDGGYESVLEPLSALAGVLGGGALYVLGSLAMDLGSLRIPPGG